MALVRLVSVSLLSLATLLSLSGCGGTGSNPSSSSTTTAGSSSGTTGSGAGSGTTGSGSGSTGSGSGSSGSTASGVAYVYVSGSASGNTNQVTAYAAASDGSLKPITGSPFPFNIQFMAVNGKYLFGDDGTNIISYAINSDGSLKQVSSVDADAKSNVAPQSGAPGPLFLDKSGQSLYDGFFNLTGTGNEGYQFWNVQSDGSLQFVGDTGQNSNAELGGPMTFTKDDKYAYGAFCYHFAPDIFGYQRNSNGSLTAINTNATTPNSECPYLTAVSNDFHLFTTLNPNTYGTGQTGPTQIGVYAINADGTLTISSSAATPTTVGNSIRDLKLDPTSAYLAVAGQGGLQLFQTHGSSPVTPLGGLLVSTQIDQMFWDNANHLYAISQKGNNLYVFTVSSTGAVPAPGSPYTISAPSNLTVQPLT